MKKDSTCNVVGNADMPAAAASESDTMLALAPLEAWLRGIAADMTRRARCSREQLRHARELGLEGHCFVVLRKHRGQAA
jgi:hypothetical protein